MSKTSASVSSGGSKHRETDEQRKYVEEKEAEARCKLLLRAQDIVYGVSGGTKWTPKHVRLIII